MSINQSYGITTALFAVTEPEEDAPETAEEHDGSIEVPSDKEGRHSAVPSVKFQHHRQEGHREQTSGLPVSLTTSPLHNGRGHGRQSR
jgi:hypothetical protein